VTEAVLRRLWPLLQRQVKGLKVPWLDEMTALGRDPFKVLVSCILSLRTQDKTTAEASARLFSLATTPAALDGLPVRQIEKAIYPVGFYRVKARNLKELAAVLVGQHASHVPDEIDDLLRLKGVGRKTANLVVTLGYDKPGICVDTHVHRITNRWGFVKTKNPEETEFALRARLPRAYWKKINGLLVAFGQRICKPLSPLCSACSLEAHCERVDVGRHR
jgi:endonuclease-3